MPRMKTVLRISDGEWRRIAPVLPTPKETRRRHPDRDVLSALFYTEAAGTALEAVPPKYKIGHRTLSGRRSAVEGQRNMTKNP